MLFPLPLTPFEEYMLVDDQPAYPMSCFFKITLQGQFDVALFTSALEETLPNHPLLASSVTETKGKYYWHNMHGQRTGIMPVIARQSLDAERQYPTAKGIDLFREPAMKVTICNENTDPAEVSITGQTDIIFETHHSASDAAGTARFIEDILCNYAQKTGVANIHGANIQRAPVNPDLLARRSNPWQRRRIIELLFGCFRAWKFLMNRILPLTPKKTSDLQKLPAEYPAILCRNLTEAETQNVQQKAKQLGITINDLFLCSAFLAMKKWQEQHAADKREGHLRIAVPVNLRTPADEQMPAANIVSMTFLDRKVEKIQATQEFYQGVHKEIQHIKRYNLGWSFIRSLTIYRRVVGNFRKMMHPDRCWATATVTNLGRLFDDVPLPKREGRVQINDSLELIGVTGSPPVRSSTAIGISVLTYADYMTISIHYDSAILTRCEAQSILDDAI